jgi:hypothetical protein
VRCGGAASLLATAALVAAGCAQETDGAPRLGPPDSSLSAAEAASEEALADSTLLTLDDFPDSWLTAPAPADDVGEVTIDDLARCLDTEGATQVADLPHASTPAFVSPGGDMVMARVFLAPDETRPRRAIEILRDQAAPDCYAEAYQAGLAAHPPEGLPPEVEFGTVTGIRLPYTAFGNTTVAWRMSIPVAVDHENVNVYIDNVVVRVDRALVALSFQTQLRPYDRDRSEGVTQTLVERVTEAVAEET